MNDDWRKGMANGAYQTPQGTTWWIIRKYLPERMTHHRRHMEQEIKSLLQRKQTETLDSFKFSLRNQPLWKRIWTAITKDY